jgi:hypothetical protein
VHAYRANNESMSLWDMPLQLWAEFVEVNAMDAFWTPPWSFRLFMGENRPLYGEVIVLKGPVTLGEGGEFNFLLYSFKYVNKIYLKFFNFIVNL